MPRLPRVKSKETIQALKRNGFFIDHISGSHYILYHKNNGIVVTVPFHNKDLKLGTLSSILKQAKITVRQFIELL